MKKCSTVSLFLICASALSAPTKPPKLLSPNQQIRKDLLTLESNNLSALFARWRKAYPAPTVLGVLRDIATNSRSETSTRSTALLGYSYFAQFTPGVDPRDWMNSLTGVKNPWLLRLSALQSIVKLNQGKWPAELDPLLRDRAQIVREEAQRLHAISMRTQP